jgi:hypothetical protein
MDEVCFVQAIGDGGEGGKRRMRSSVRPGRETVGEEAGGESRRRREGEGSDP